MALLMTILAAISSSLLEYVDTRVGTAEATTMTAGLYLEVQNYKMPNGEWKYVEASGDPTWFESGHMRKGSKVSKRVIR